MKRFTKILFTTLLFSGIYLYNTDVFAQNPVCAYCGTQLPNGVHSSTCPYYVAPKSTTKVPNTTTATDVNSVIVGEVFQSLLNAVFSDDSQNNQKELEAKQRQAAIDAELAAKQRKLNQIKAQEEHDKMMGSFKSLENTNLSYKTLDSEVEKNKKQSEFDFNDATWVETQKQIFKERIEKPNKWANEIYNSLKTNAPISTSKGLGELEPGDVILLAPSSGEIGGAIVTDISNFGQKGNESTASHTVTYLKEVNGKKMFLDNQINEGCTIINEEDLRERYVDRVASVAKVQKDWGVAQPLNTEEAEKLWNRAKELQAKNTDYKINKSNWWLGDASMYGVGKDNMVCSEASWELLKAGGRELPLSKSWQTWATTVKFSPADFYAYKQYFLITPLDITK